MPFDKYGFKSNKDKYDLALMESRIAELEDKLAGITDDDSAAAHAAMCPIPVGGIYMSFVNSITEGGYTRNYIPGKDFWIDTQWEDIPSGYVLYSGGSGSSSFADGTNVKWEVNDNLTRRLSAEQAVFEKEQIIRIKQANLPAHEHPIPTEFAWHHHNVANQQSTPPYGISLPDSNQIYTEGGTGGSTSAYVIRPNYTPDQNFIVDNGDGALHIQQGVQNPSNPITTLNPMIPKEGGYAEITATDVAKYWKAKTNENFLGSQIPINHMSPGFKVYMWRRIR